MRIRKPLFVFLYLIFLILLLEVWARAYYAMERGVPFFSSAADQVYMWYPELKKMDGYEYDEDKVNILLLGGSALTEEWGKVPPYLSEEAGSVLGKEANIVNLAAPAHSSLDSLYKYRWVGGERFDLVVFYHGINEVRANNVPAELWKNDYSHYSWYDEVNFFFRHDWLRGQPFVLPYFVKHLLVQLDREVIHRGRHVPTHSPKQEWLECGKEIKTKASFGNNIRRIAETARRRKEPLMVMTFAYFYPEGDEYDEESPYVSFTRIWGLPENVMLGIREHNEVIRRIAPDAEFILLDQQELMGGKKRNFEDICHFSDEGSRVFAGNVVGKYRDIYLLRKEEEEK